MTFKELATRIKKGIQTPANLANILVEGFENLEDSGGGSTTTYSTEEHEVGTWIDGSTVYEKTIVKTQLAFQDSFALIDSTLTATSVKEIISYEGSVKTSDGTAYTSLCGLPGMNLWIFGVHNNINGLGLYGSSANALSGGTAICTIRYTKNE